VEAFFPGGSLVYRQEGFVGSSLAAESLLSLAVTVTSEQRVESVLQSIVQGLAAQPGMALARIWLLPSVHHPSFYNVVSDPPDCLCLVASAGTPINSPQEDWSFLQGHFARVSFNVGKVGQVATSRHPILVEDVAAQNDWIVRPEWAKREEIRSFAGHPLIFRDKLLGVIAVFSRQPLGQQKFTWLGLFANQAALAIANACTEEALRSSERNLTAIINTIPTAAWTTRPDGYCDFLNQVWLDHTGMTAEQAQGWGWAEAIHPDDRKTLVEEWQSCLASGTPVDTEARIRRFDSSYRWFLIRGNPLNDERGNILKWYGTCVDIEDRKRGEEALRTRELSWRQIVDNIPGLVATTSAMGEVEFLNRQTLEYFGKTNEDLENWALIGAVHPDDLPRVIEARKKSIETGQIYEIEHRCRRADGVYRWFQVRGLPVRDTQNHITAWYLLLTDIDDRKRAEEALRTRELDARSLLDNMPGFLASLSPDGTPEIFNRPFLQYLGITTEETKKWKTNDVIHPDDLAHSIEVFGNAISKGQPLDIEHRLRRFDGVYRWFQVRMVPVRDVEGRILHWNALTTDIEDRKRAEEALQSSERNLSLMISAIPTYIHVLRADGSVLYVNQAVRDYFGITLDEAQKEDYRARFFHPDDVERLREERREALTRPVPFENEQRVLGKDGKYRWFLIRYNPLLDEQGRIDRWYAAATDIEDRKRAEEALRASERNLNMMINAIPTMVGVLRADGSVLYVNQAASDYTGLSLEDLQKGDYRLSVYHPEDVESLGGERWLALTRPVPFENEQRILGKDGRYRWFLTRYNPVLDEQGRIDRWYGAATDIEDRKKAEKALQSSERDLRSIISTIPTMVWSAAPDGSVDFFNPRWLDYTGLSADESRNWKWTEAIHPDDLSRLSDAWQGSLVGGEPGEAEARVRRFDGAYRWFLFRANSLRDESGKIVKWYGTNTDIDDRKRAEAQVEQAYLRLAEAQRLSKTGSFITDLLVDEHDWSAEAFRIFEFDPAAKVTVQMIRDRIHPEDLPTFDAVIARGIAGTDVDFGFRIVTSRGVVKHLRGMARVMGQSAGHPLFIGALQDVTESKLAEEALNRTRSELAHVARVTTLNALTASIAHEVNQPLSGIVSNASASLRFLSGDAPNLEEAREAVRDIVRDGKRAAEIITRIRALTKRTPMSREKLDLNETISEVLALIGDEARRQSVIVRTQLADSLPPVAGDRVQLQQVVMNLVMNAIEAMSNVRERLRELVVITQNTDAECVQATVEDSGTGIASDTVDKIFDSFYTTKPGGMGMGLSISRSILQYHGGRLWAVAKNDAGTMFHFTVPKYREEGAYAPVTPT
jgi:PAS domain S-box-containing protein